MLGNKYFFLLINLFNFLKSDTYLTLSSFFGMLNMGKAHLLLFSLLSICRLGRWYNFHFGKNTASMFGFLTVTFLEYDALAFLRTTSHSLLRFILACVDPCPSNDHLSVQFYWDQQLHILHPKWYRSWKQSSRRKTKHYWSIVTAISRQTLGCFLLT